MQQSALPEPEGRDHDDYRIGARSEVLAALREVATRRSLVTLYYAGTHGFFVTSLLAIDADKGELVFDRAQDEAANRILAGGGRLVFVTFVDHIKTQFAGENARSTIFGGEPAFRIALPATVLRLQRRNHFRVSLPMSAPLACEIPAPAGSALRLQIRDLSVGGLGLIAASEIAGFAPGVVLHGCRIDLPGQGMIIASIELRSAVMMRRTAGSEAYLCYGCRFVDLAGTSGNMIQRYIMQAERSRMALR